MKYILSRFLFLIAVTFSFVVAAYSADFIQPGGDPEQIDSVRICDSYGTGYFFIPGTEVCLGFGGDLRAEFGKLDIDNEEFGSLTENFTEWRARLHAKIRTETKFGTLSGKLRVSGTASNIEAIGAFDQGYLELAGFSAGFRESAIRRSLWTSVPKEYTTNDSRPFLYADGAPGFHNAWYGEYTFAVPTYEAISVIVGGQNASGFSSSDRVIDPYAIVTYTDPEGLFSAGASVLYGVGDDFTPDDAIIVTGFANVVLAPDLFLGGFYQTDLEESGTAYIVGDTQYAVFLGANLNPELTAQVGFSGNDGSGTNEDEQVISGALIYQPDTDHNFFIQPQVDYGIGDTEGYRASVRALWEIN